MSGPNGIERRDPAAGILKLGQTLSTAHAKQWTGTVRVKDEHLVHTIRLVHGQIALGSPLVPRRLEQLFGLPRPHVVLDDRPLDVITEYVIDPEPFVVRGVANRRDLFEPRTLLDRIPVEVLRVRPHVVGRLAKMGLSAEEIAFVDQLKIPTPLTMALWKRGLDPTRAGAMVVALNLLGAFEAWAPGDLPRLTEVNRLQRLVQNGRPDHELLGVPGDASLREIDRAFRKLSLVLHPDRLTGLPAPEAERAGDMYLRLSRAHARLKGSRRSRPVRHDRSATPFGESSAAWAAALHRARAASRRGDRIAARTYAIKALTQSPSKDAAQELKDILRRVA